MILLTGLCAPQNYKLTKYRVTVMTSPVRYDTIWLIYWYRVVKCGIIVKCKITLLLQLYKVMKNCGSNEQASRKCHCNEIST